MLPLHWGKFLKMSIDKSNTILHLEKWKHAYDLDQKQVHSAIVENYWFFKTLLLLIISKF